MSNHLRNLLCSCLHDLMDRLFLLHIIRYWWKLKVVISDIGYQISFKIGGGYEPVCTQKSYDACLCVVLGGAVSSVFQTTYSDTHKEKGRIIYCYLYTPPFDEKSYIGPFVLILDAQMFLSVHWYKLWMYLMYTLWPILCHLYNSIRTRLTNCRLKK